MLAPVLMDAVKVLLWLLLQQVYVMKGLGGPMCYHALCRVM